MGLGCTTLPWQPRPEIVADPDLILEDTDEFPAGLRICCIDDSAVARRLVALHVKQHFPGSTVEQFGHTLQEVDAFKRTVMSGADIAILDQNLEYGTTTVFGTTLVQQLLADNFKGLLCIRSANSSEVDVALYTECGAHCAVDKAAQPKEMVEAIKVAYLRHVAQHRPLEGTSGSLNNASCSTISLQGSRSPSAAPESHGKQRMLCPDVDPTPAHPRSSSYVHSVSSAPLSPVSV